MKPVPCELVCTSDIAHLQQVYTGFVALARRGEVRLRQRVGDRARPDPTAPPHLRDKPLAHLRARIGGVEVAYDVHDSGVIDAALLDGVRWYFKRGWEAEHVDRCAHPERVVPLGPNLWVHAEPVDLYALRRARLHDRDDAVKFALRALGLDRVLGDRLVTPRVADLHAEPPVDLAPRVLFLAEAWDPADAPSEATAAEREQLTAVRAACMRGLRAAFGELVTCGFRATPFSRRAYPDLVVDDPRTTHKRNYLQLVREHAICVATTGLHHSVGWKFAEYLSMSRAIVSERLFMRMPGPLAAGTHYLEFATADDCVAQVGRLMVDPVTRAAMMRANADYYRLRIEPGALVRRTIDVALGRSAG